LSVKLLRTINDAFTAWRVEMVEEGFAYTAHISWQTFHADGNAGIILKLKLLEKIAGYLL